MSSFTQVLKDNNYPYVELTDGKIVIGHRVDNTLEIDTPEWSSALCDWSLECFDVLAPYRLIHVNEWKNTWNEWEGTVDFWMLMKPEPLPNLVFIPAMRF